MNNNSKDCWASDVASRHGKYYFYFSDRKRGIGVMTSNSPKGKFKDTLGKPLVAPMHDPTVFIDDYNNENPYLIYGDKEGGGFHVARLNQDMVSLAEPPKPITITGEEWENAPQWMDKNYFFKRGDVYYLSWGRDYAISNSIYGPYQCVGPVGNGHNLNQFAHGSFFNWKGQFYHVWCYYIKQGFKFRESVITYCHFDDEGRIVTDTSFLDAHFSYGVGRYNASWDKLEAEWYYEISDDIKKKGSKANGFVLTHIKNDNWVRFSNVTFNKFYKRCKAYLKTNAKNAVLNIRLNNPKGEVFGTIKLSQTDTFKEFECNLKAIKGKADLYLVFSGAKDDTLQLDWFRFE